MIQLTQLLTNIYHAVKDEVFFENKQHKNKYFRQRNCASSKISIIVSIS